MRHATWLRLEASPFWYEISRRYRRLPDGLRAPLRTLLMPHWYLTAYLVCAAAGNRIVAGPFRGMRLALSPLSSRNLLGYILGSQELELHQVIERIAARGYRRIVNVGAADGYYAVGLALRLPEAQVAAFEALPEYHPLIRKSARLNGVADRVATYGLCDAPALNCHLPAAAAPSLVLMDIEGGEKVLLDADRVPGLRHSDILVETHDAIAPHVTDTLIDRFWTTHNVECYAAQPRILDDFPRDFLPFLPRWLPHLAVDLMDERRTGVQRWLFLTAKSGNAERG